MMRYYGGKWRIAPWVISHFPTHKIYVEPFGGAASVLLRKPRSYAEVYNDLDGSIVNVFRVARDHGAELKRLLEMTPYARDEFELAYEDTEDLIERARRTLIRSMMGFSSVGALRKTGFRSNTTRSYTTPATDWTGYPAALEGIIERLRGVVIENKDALKVMASQDTPDTLHYVDPPYVLSTRDDKEYRHEMDDTQHRELGAFLRDLKGRVIVSGYESPLYDELFAGWVKREKDSVADQARRRKEVLWMNFHPDVSLFS